MEKQKFIKVKNSLIDLKTITKIVRKGEFTLVVLNNSMKNMTFKTDEVEHEKILNQALEIANS